MEHDPLVQSKTNAVLRKILSEEISMRPKLRYRIRFALAVLVIALITGISIFLFSFISFLVRASQQEQLLHFGFSGVVSFVVMFPWLLFAVDVLLIAFLEYLLRQFRFGYRHSVMYLLLALIAGVGLIGIAVDYKTDIHESLLRSADKHLLPAFNGLYERVHAPLPHENGVCRCIITSTDPLLARDDSGGAKAAVFPVILAPDKIEKEGLNPGAHVFMIGSFDNGAFTPVRIKLLMR
jgi:hypothetical protein